MDNQSNSNSITLTSPAKLNLFLHINRRRGHHESFAGYHELQTAFQILNYGDTLSFRAPGKLIDYPSDRLPENSANNASENKTRISISPALEGVPLEQNLIYKAACLLKQHAKETSLSELNDKINQLSADITIEKVLPMGGGLGGGSSNAATTLLALNKIWDLNFDTTTLTKIGAKLGADVPVFVQGHTAFANGIGEELSPITLPEQWYVVLHPECHISTAEIFSHERLTRDTPKKRIAPALEGHNSELFEKLLSEQYRNDFEKLVCELYPQVQDCIQWLRQFGNARMTGTGACCFCSVNSKEVAEKVLNEARSKFKGFIAKGVQISPALQRLNEA